MNKSQKQILRKYNSKPTKPSRLTVKQSFSLNSGITLQSILEWAKGYPEIKPEDIEIVQEYDYEDDSESKYYELVRYVKEPEDRYLSRFNKYLKKLTIWEEWYKENEQTITKLLEEQKKESTITNEQKINKLLKQIKKRQEQVDKLTKNNN